MLNKLYLHFIFLFTCFAINIGIAANKDSLYYSSKTPTTNRLLLFDKKYFVQMRLEIATKDSAQLGLLYNSTAAIDDTSLIVTMGEYYTMNDTIYFSFPDTNYFKNKFFCCCKIGNDTANTFHVLNKETIYFPDETARIYKYIFGKKRPNITEMHLEVMFKAARKGKYIRLQNGDEFFLRQ